MGLAKLLLVIHPRGKEQQVGHPITDMSTGEISIP